METESQIFWTFSSIIPNEKAYLQARTISKMENLWCVLYIITRIEHYKKQVDE